jgi:transposase
MRDEELFNRQAGTLFNIRKSDIIVQWKRRYDESGLDTLSQQPGSGLHKKMPKLTPLTQIEFSDEDTRTRDDMLAELNRLQMEIDYLLLLASCYSTVPGLDIWQSVISVRRVLSSERQGLR